MKSRAGADPEILPGGGGGWLLVLNYTGVWVAGRPLPIVLCTKGQVKGGGGGGVASYPIHPSPCRGIGE